MTDNLYGNPHSQSTPSALAGHRVDEIRLKTLLFFNADPAEWDLVFTANATAAIKLVLECFRDHSVATNIPMWYGYHRDSHTSIVGGREFTRSNRCFNSDEEVEEWISKRGLFRMRTSSLGLLAYPGQSNMTGRRLPLKW
jgi:molybdenum cofactor sulfurtransferase